MKTSGFLTLALPVFFNLPAQAHPGHGPGEEPPAHFIESADHFSLLLVLAVILFCAVCALRGRKSHGPASS